MFVPPLLFFMTIIILFAIYKYTPPIKEKPEYTLSAYFVFIFLVCFHFYSIIILFFLLTVFVYINCILKITHTIIRFFTNGFVKTLKEIKILNIILNVFSLFVLLYILVCTLIQSEKFISAFYYYPSLIRLMTGGSF